MSQSLKATSSMISVVVTPKAPASDERATVAEAEDHPFVDEIDELADDGNGLQHTIESGKNVALPRDASQPTKNSLRCATLPGHKCKWPRKIHILQVAATVSSLSELREVLPCAFNKRDGKLSKFSRITEADVLPALAASNASSREKTCPSPVYHARHGRITSEMGQADRQENDVDGYLAALSSEAEKNYDDGKNDPEQSAKNTAESPEQIQLVPSIPSRSRTRIKFTLGGHETSYLPQKTSDSSARSPHPAKFKQLRIDCQSFEVSDKELESSPKRRDPRTSQVGSKRRKITLTTEQPSQNTGSEIQDENAVVSPTQYQQPFLSSRCNNKRTAEVLNSDEESSETLFEPVSPSKTQQHPATTATSTPLRMEPIPNTAQSSNIVSRASSTQNNSRKPGRGGPIIYGTITSPPKFGDESVEDEQLIRILGNLSTILSTYGSIALEKKTLPNVRTLPWDQPLLHDAAIITPGPSNTLACLLRKLLNVPRGITIKKKAETYQINTYRAQSWLRGILVAIFCEFVFSEGSPFGDDARCLQRLIRYGFKSDFVDKLIRDHRISTLRGDPQDQDFADRITSRQSSFTSKLNLLMLPYIGADTAFEELHTQIAELGTDLNTLLHTEPKGRFEAIQPNLGDSFDPEAHALASPENENSDGTGMTVLMTTMIGIKFQMPEREDWRVCVPAKVEVLRMANAGQAQAKTHPHLG